MNGVLTSIKKFLHKSKCFVIINTWKTFCEKEIIMAWAVMLDNGTVGKLVQDNDFNEPEDLIGELVEVTHNIENGYIITTIGVLIDIFGEC